MGRTTVELDDYLIKRCMEITGLKSKSKVVDLALRELLRDGEAKVELRERRINMDSRQL